MRKFALSNFPVVLSLLMMSCASPSNQTKTVAAPPPPVTAAQKRDVSYLVPAELSYAKDFVQLLSDSGWSIEAVYPSKFSGFFSETSRAAFIKTDRGAIEAIFFEKGAEVEQIHVDEEQGRASGYHKYIIETPMTKQKIEGAACYFKKYRTLFIITGQPVLNDALNRLGA